MFQGLPQHERQAFFSLLDEYFDARPHLLPLASGSSSNTTDNGNAVEGASTSQGLPQLPASVKPAIASHIAQHALRTATSPPSSSSTSTPVSSPAPPARKSVLNAPAIPAGLSSSKTFGRMSTSSAGSAFGSLVMGGKQPQAPRTPAEGITPSVSSSSSSSSSVATNSLPPPARSGPAVPAPPPTATTAKGGSQGEALYDYALTDAEADDLPVHEGDIVSLVEKVSDDWWKARAADGREGIVPASYIRIM